MFTENFKPFVAIVDYGLGNLFSVKHACTHVGLHAQITSDKNEILAADAVLLPGVGAYKDAMDTLHKLDLVSVLRDVADSEKPLVGVCLGIQLLMTESFEFGNHKGLGIIDGNVVRLENPIEGEKRLKVPEICWNRVYEKSNWAGTLLDGVSSGESFYFVHSYYVQTNDPSIVLSTTRYGQIEFCSSLQFNNVFACQFHPEKSGKQGIKIYSNLKQKLLQRNLP